MRTLVLAVLACAACATIDMPVTNENYQTPARAQSCARSENAMDHVRRGEDPCADEPGHESRPAIETVVRAGDEDDAPVPDDGGGCTVWGPGRLTHVTIRGSTAFAPSLVGAREVASIDGDGTVFRHGLLGNQEAGEVRCGKLVLAGLMEDRIVARIEPGAVVTTGLFNRRYARAAPCSERQAAVGAYALMVLDEEREGDEQTRDRKAKDEARRGEQQQRDDQLRRQRDQDFWDAQQRKKR